MQSGVLPRACRGSKLRICISRTIIVHGSTSDQTGLDLRHELCHCVKKKFAPHMVDGMRLIHRATLCFPCYVRCLGLFGESGPHQLRYETSAIRGFVIFPSVSDLH